MNTDAGTLSVYLTSLACGLLIGLERERHVSAKAGLRTFALVALLGTSSGMLADRSGSSWILAGCIVVLGGMMIAAHRADVGQDMDPGTTSTVALVLSYVIGAMLWYRQQLAATALTLGVTALLYFKTELHGATRALSRRDVVSFLQFAALAFVILPMLPDRGFGPYDALNAFEIGVMVVVVSGLSLAGYAALRLAGPTRGLLLMGALGGLVSSTLTTIVFARRVRRGEAEPEHAALAILSANLTTLLRLLVLCAIFAPSMLSALLPVLLAGFAAGAVAPWRLWSRLRSSVVAPHIEIANPAELPTALTAGAMFALVLLASTWIHERAGTLGLYSAAAVFGLTDLDAISLSNMRMFQSQQILGSQALHALVIAYCANLLLKAVIARVLGNAALLGLLAWSGLGMLGALTVASLFWS